ncbi:MAG: D-2-hydroxyacid dehydrogenase [Gemmataceae bacterium]
MTHIAVEVELEAATLQAVQQRTPSPVQILPPHDGWWNWEGPTPEVLLCKRPPRNLDALPGLRFIQISTVGYEHLRDLGFENRNIRLCNARGIFDTAIAEWNLAMMVNLTRDLRTMIRHQEQGVWERAPRFQQEIRGRVVGIWGYGGIGRATAQLARAFGMTIHVMTRLGIFPRESAWAEPGTGDPDGSLPDRVFVQGQDLTFLGSLDFLILALPHTRHSEGMIGERELQALPRSAFLLNPARGPIVQEQALLQALRRGWIAGAALDTHFAYPLPADHPLWRFPNVMLTPHISGADHSHHFRSRIGRLFLENLDRYLAQRPLFNELTRIEWQEA